MGVWVLLAWNMTCTLPCLVVSIEPVKAEAGESWGLQVIDMTVFAVDCRLGVKDSGDMVYNIHAQHIVLSACHRIEKVVIMSSLGIVRTCVEWNRLG